MTQDWVKDNWSFLSARPHKVITQNRLLSILTENASTAARFYGEEGLCLRYANFAHCTPKGQWTLLLRPFIKAAAPEPNIKAVYIDRKRYKFNAEGKIVGLDSLYEVPFYVIVE